MEGSEYNDETTFEGNRANKAKEVTAAIDQRLIIADTETKATRSGQVFSIAIQQSPECLIAFAAAISNFNQHLKASKKPYSAKRDELPPEPNNEITTV